MNDRFDRDNRGPDKRLRVILGVLIGLVAVAVVVFVVVLMRRMELASETEIEGAGTAASRTRLTEQDRALAEELELDLENGEYPEVEDTGVLNELYYNGRLYRFNSDLSILLLLGIDDREVEKSDTTRNESQADLLLVAAFDESAQTCKLVQINRDTMTDVPVLGYFGGYLGMVEEQIALAHTYGHGLEDSCENTVWAVSRFLYNIPIDNYFAFTMDAIPIMNDLVGGVTVTIEDDFTGVDDTLIMGETITLDSGNVENFVRSRMYMPGDSTNLARMRRQRMYLTGLAAGLREKLATESSFVMKAYSALGDYLVTDCSLDQLSAYGDQFGTYDLEEIVSPDGEAVKGDVYMEYYVDNDALQQLVIDTFYVPVEE